MLLDKQEPEPHPKVAAALYERRFQRYLRSTELPNFGKGYCRWCGVAVKPPKQSWCGKACLNAYLFRNSPNKVRLRLAERDGGICAHCGLDTEWLRAEMRRDKQHWRWTRWLEGHRSTYYWNTPQPIEPPAWAMPWLRFDPADSLWDADHILPVSEGGGCCGLDNFRTLCKLCHQAETRALHRRRRPDNNDPDQLEIF